MRLLELREEKNLTQQDVANAIKTSRTNIGRWEKGQNEPTANYIISLANFFEVSTDYLLGREDDFGNVSIPAPSMSADAQELLRIFESLDPMHREQILEYARYFANRSAKAGKTDKKKIAT